MFLGKLKYWNKCHFFSHRNNAVLSQLPLSWLRQRASLLRAFGHHIMQLLSFCDLTLRFFFLIFQKEKINYFLYFKKDPMYEVHYQLFLKWDIYYHHWQERHYWKLIFQGYLWLRYFFQKFLKFVFFFLVILQVVDWNWIDYDVRLSMMNKIWMIL